MCIPSIFRFDAESTSSVPHQHKYFCLYFNFYCKIVPRQTQMVNLRKTQTTDFSVYTLNDLAAKPSLESILLL